MDYFNCQCSGTIYRAAIDKQDWPFIKILTESE